MPASERRLAKNERLFREVNERIRTLNVPREEGGVAEYLCECSRRECTEQLSLSVAEYEGARRTPWHFFVVPGHENPEVERVVARHETYVIVEKSAEALAED